MAKSKQKPCVIQGCPALRKKGAYVCAAHATTHNTGRAAVVGASSVRAHKYGAVATTVDGVRFASKAEARYYSELKLREKAGEITELRLQTVWPLRVDRILIGTYLSDFDYRPIDLNGMPCEIVVVDVKGVKTPLYRWKKKHFEVQYGLKITEV